MLLAPVVGCVVLTVGVVVGTAILPFYCSYRLHKKRKQNKSCSLHNLRRDGSVQGKGEINCM